MNYPTVSSFFSPPYKLWILHGVWYSWGMFSWPHLLYSSLFLCVCGGGPLWKSTQFSCPALSPSYSHSDSISKLTLLFACWGFRCPLSSTPPTNCRQHLKSALGLADNWWAAGGKADSPFYHPHPNFPELPWRWGNATVKIDTWKEKDGLGLLAWSWED